MNLKKIFRNNVLIRIFNFLGRYTYFGEIIFFPRNSTTFISGYKSGIYESDVLSIINGLIQPKTFFFDIGTNIGTISVPVLSCNSDINVVSFEASPNTLPYLIKTHHKSSFNKRWLIVTKAIADKEGIVSFTLSKKSNGAFDSIIDTKRVTAKQVVEVQTTTIDCEWKRLNKPKVSVIKCDIEGADLLALHGAKECIGFNQPSIIIEWNKHNIKAFGFTAEDLFNFLYDMNYKIYALPSFVDIKNADELSMHQILCETYLLKPLS